MLGSLPKISGFPGTYILIDYVHNWHLSTTLEDQQQLNYCTKMIARLQVKSKNTNIHEKKIPNEQYVTIIN